MNSVRNGIGMRETEITREPSRLWNPHSYAIFAQVHNTLYSIPLACSFRHNGTLQHHRFPSVTTTLTKVISIQGEPNFPEFIDQRNKRCMLVFLKPGADCSRGRAGMRLGYILLATHPHPGIRESTLETRPSCPSVWIYAESRLWTFEHAH